MTTAQDDNFNLFDDWRYFIQQYYERTHHIPKYITAAPRLLTHVQQCGSMKKSVVGGELQEKERTWISLEYRTEVSQSVV